MLRRSAAAAGRLVLAGDDGTVWCFRGAADAPRP